MKYDQLQEVHESMVNGQRHQAVKEMKSYGLYDFFADYKRYLHEDIMCSISNELEFFADAVVSYHRIAANKKGK